MAIFVALIVCSSCLTLRHYTNKKRTNNIIEMLFYFIFSDNFNYVTSIIKWRFSFGRRKILLIE